MYPQNILLNGCFYPKAPRVCAVGGPTGAISSPQSFFLSQRAGSSSQPSGPWPHTSPSCWPSGRSHTGSGGGGGKLKVRLTVRSAANYIPKKMCKIKVHVETLLHGITWDRIRTCILTFHSIRMMIPRRTTPARTAETMIHNGNSYGISAPTSGSISTVNWRKRG